MLIDTHCHIHNAELFSGAKSRELFNNSQDLTAEQILANAAENDVRRIIVIGTSHADSLIARNFAAKYSTEELPIDWTYGIHPGEFEQPRPQDLLDFFEEDVIKPLKSASKLLNGTGLEDIDNSLVTHTPQPPIAIGEVGLDYHYGPEAYGGVHFTVEEIRQNQFRLLEEMLDLAIKNSLPLSFHVREAFPDFFAILDNFTSSRTAAEMPATQTANTTAATDAAQTTDASTTHKLRGVVHCFTDNKKNLQKVLDRDLYIGVDGVATYSTLPLPPLERTLIETDAPYLAPIPYRHQINQPAYVKNIAEWLAGQHHTTLDQVAEQTTENAIALFDLSFSECSGTKK